MSTEHRDLIAERHDGVLYLTMNRPDKLNALSDQMIAGLLEELSRAAHDREVGAVVLTGAGRGFCAGGDIGRMRERNEGGGSDGTRDRVTLGRRSRNPDAHQLAAPLRRGQPAASRDAEGHHRRDQWTRRGRRLEYRARLRSAYRVRQPHASAPRSPASAFLATSAAPIC